jgi:hypothetical protein
MSLSRAPPCSSRGALFPSVGSARCKADRLAVESARSQRKDHVPTWLWVVIIVVVVLAVLGFFGRGRLSR